MRPAQVHKDAPDVGDVVRATYDVGPRRVTVQAEIAHVYRVRGARLLVASDGEPIYRPDAKALTVQLVKAYEPVQPPLF